MVLHPVQRLPCRYATPARHPCVPCSPAVGGRAAQLLHVHGVLCYQQVCI